MMTPKEIFLELLKPDGKPERQLVQYEALQMVLGDPIGRYLHQGRRPGATITDHWGTVIEWPADAAGSMPLVTEENKVIKDITRWRDYVHAPDIPANCSDPEAWEKCRAKARERAGDERLITGFMGTGIFEQCHFLMPFQEVLTNLYDHPKEMHELIDYITEYLIGYVKHLIENLRPDAIFSHDDWGTKDALFMKPDMWREFYKEPYRRFYGYIRSQGVIAIHHADSYLAPIVDDMVEIGIQVWQGTLPENNIPKLQEHLKGRLVLMGGIGAAIDREDAGEEEVRAYVRNALHEYCPGGHFIPSITYGLAGAIYKHIDPWIDDEIRLYNEGVRLPRFKAPVSARIRPVTIVSEAPAEPQTPVPAADAKPVPASPEAQAVGQAILAALSEALQANRTADLAGTLGRAALEAMGSRTAAASAPVQPEAPQEAPSIELSMDQASLLSDVSDALQDCSVRQTLAAVQACLDAGIPAQMILSKGLVRGMNELGEDFSAGEVFVPEMLRAAKCMSSATEVLKPLLAGETGGKPLGRVCLGTVRGDLHDIGKNLVKIMMEGSGLEVIDLGCDVAAETFVQTAIEQDCQLIALSALLTTSMEEMRRVVEIAEEQGIRDKVRILIGGAPITQEYCDQIGADAYTDDAAAAARAAVQLLK